MFSTLERPYKNKSAKDTIKLIETILKRIDMCPNYEFYGNPYPEIFSVRVALPNEKGGFGSNGKGRTEEYSIASGYAEFMERLQNNLYATLPRTMMEKLKENHGFYYVPDEKYITEKELRDLPENILLDLVGFRKKDKDNFIRTYCERNLQNNGKGIVALPFYNTKTKELVNIPYNLLLMCVGSNGMAAGNTVSEAVFQALCELMERWGSAEIFYKQLTPPTVPDEYLSQFKEECSIIENIQKDGQYKIIVKDFSAGKKLPSVGIIIIDPKTNRYRLNVGSDTSFQVALSRCITEIYQGIENKEKFEKTLNDIPKEVPEYFLSNNSKCELDKYIVFSEFCKNDSGVFPPSLFSDTPSYEFEPEAFIPKESYEKEVEAMISNFHKEGYEVYIRDCSYLGFPSVMVYIPEVAALGKKNVPVISSTNKFNLIELDKIENLLFDFDNCEEYELKKIEQVLTPLLSNTILTDLFSIKVKKGSKIGKVALSFFLILLRYKLKEYDRALDSLKVYTSKGTKNDNYYSVVKKYIELKRDYVKEDEILELLSTCDFELELVKEVCNDLNASSDIFRYIALPKCPDCDNCKLGSECLSKYQYVYSNVLYEEMKKNIINQKRLEACVQGLSI